MAPGPLPRPLAPPPARAQAQVEVRPGFETLPPTAEEIASIKEQEHALRVREEMARAATKRVAIQDLKRRVGVFTFHPLLTGSVFFPWSTSGWAKGPGAGVTCA